MRWKIALLIALVVGAIGGSWLKNLPGFVIASLIGRGARFFLVAGFVVAGGERMASALPKYVERIGWAVVLLAVVAGVIITQSD